MFAWRPFGFEPFGEDLGMLQREFDRLLNMGPASTRPADLVCGAPALTETGTDEVLWDPKQGMVWKPRTDVRESDNFTYVYTELPGLKPEDIKITLQEGNLRISGERKPEIEEGESITWRTMEIPFGPFQRDIPVPIGTDARQIQANFENGILTIRIRKPERFKEIPVMTPEKVKGKEKQLGEREEPSRVGGQPERPREESTAGTSPQDVNRPIEVPAQRGGTDQGPATSQTQGTAQPQGTTQPQGTAQPTERLTEQRTEQETTKETTQTKQAPQEPSPVERRDTQQTTGANV